MDPVPYPPGLPRQPQQTSGLSIASMVCGILGCFTWLPAIGAIVMGHIALNSINRSGNAVGGRGFAITGLITGYLGFVLGGVFVIAALSGISAPIILKQRQEADRMQSMNHMKQIHRGLVEFDSDYGAYPGDALAAKDPKFSGLTGPLILDQLEAAGKVPEMDELLAMRNIYRGSWYYFPDAMPDPSGSLPLLISPAIGTRRSLLDTSGNVRVLTEEQFTRVSVSTAIKIPSPVKK